ncbi:MAG TPA: hydrogenase maturation protease [Holophagaceae bacterium]|nr:hydrogenase maturation protease [Holophagaceae bacterium]
MSETRKPAAKVVVLGWGNPSRGDDALGPELLARVEAWIGAHPGCSVEAFQDFQLQVEHSLDLQGRDLALFVDAAVTGPDPYTFRRVAAASEADPTTHALSPGGLLRAYGTLRCGPPPPAFALAVRGHAFELGDEPGLQARINREAAWQLLERLLGNPILGAWEGLGTP